MTNEVVNQKEARLEKFRNEVSPAMLSAGLQKIIGAIPEHEMWDEESLVIDCWAAMRFASENAGH